MQIFISLVKAFQAIQTVDYQHMYNKLRKFFKLYKYNLSSAVLPSFYINTSFLLYRKQEFM